MGGPTPRKPRDITTYPRHGRLLDGLLGTLNPVRWWLLMACAGCGFDLQPAAPPVHDAPPIDAAVDALPRDVGARVLFTGYVDDAVRAWLLHHARVLAYPSLDEGFGFPLLDAMSAGLPIVASTAGSIPEVAGDAALLADADDLDGLAAALLTALGDEAERERMVAAGTRRLTELSWRSTADQLIGLYRELAERSSGGAA